MNTSKEDIKILKEYISKQLPRRKLGYMKKLVIKWISYGISCKIRKNKIIETIALLNSGFESNALDIAVPIDIAKKFGLWLPHSTTTVILDTGGGETVNSYYEFCAELELILEDKEFKKIKVNIIVNSYIDEVAISDCVASELGIMLLDFKKGMEIKGWSIGKN
jgi:hypothetical protein